jgi:predicted transposase YbfD/YdcC
LPKKTLDAACGSGNDLVTQVKGNQKSLREDCQDIARLETPSQTHESQVEKGRGRVEQRSVEVFENFIATDSKKWEPIQEMVKVKRMRQVFNTKRKTWKNTEKVAYYVSTTKLSAEGYNRLIRSHWAIENRSNNVRDNALHEDASRIRKNPCIFARLRSFALNILRANGVEGIALGLYVNALDISRVLEYRGVC